MDKKRFVVIIMFIIIFMAIIFASSLYYNDKYSVYFETGTDDGILTQYVEKNEIVNEPIEPKKEGYIFKEWQLNGETYNFDSKVNSDTILTAKWIKEEYITISFNTNSDYKIDSIKILKGDIINNLPVSIKEDYEFIGWYLNDELYTEVELYSDVTLNAQYKNSTINTTYKIEDSVKIIGKYSNSSRSLYAYNKKAIGWERKIINIIPNCEYPYVIGDSTGVTGFFKANAIEKITGR